MQKLEVMKRALLVLAVLIPVVLLLTWFLVRRVNPGLGEEASRAVIDAKPAVAESVPSYPPAFPMQDTRTTGPEDLDVCGLGPVPRGGNGAFFAVVEEAHSILTEEARRLQRSELEAERSLGLVLEMQIAGMDAVRRSMQENQKCFDDPSQCMPQFERERVRAISPMVEAIAAMAVATRDPQVYANGLQTCFKGPNAPGNCSRLTFDGWARLEPLNAIPWIGAVAEARQRGDLAAGDAAVKRIAEAQTLKNRFLPTPSVIPSLPRTSEATRALMLAELTLFHGLMPIGGYQDVLSYCRPPNVEEPSRLAVCRSILRVLQDHGETLLDHKIATDLAQATGLPAAEVEKRRQELKNLQDALGGYQNRNLYSCRWLAGAEQWIPQLGNEGELRLARALLAKNSVKR